jgi:hypothetical protein
MKTTFIIGLFFTILAIIVIARKFDRVTKKEGFVNKKCPDNTRSDGPCLMEF